MKSLDPRVNRISDFPVPALEPKAPLDQLGTFEVFVQPRQGKPFQHEGSVHATDTEIAFVLAKETFTRRFTCSSLCVAETRNVFVSHYTDDNHSVYNDFQSSANENGELESFEIYHLLRRGKQHVHAGRIEACGYSDAIVKAKQTLVTTAPVYNIWVIRTADIRFTSQEEQDMWETLSEKKFRDASDYKAGDKLKEITEKN